MVQHLPEKFGMKVGAEKFPLMVVTSFSYVCNARCPNCPYNNSTIRKNYKDALFFPEDLFKKLADECGKYHAFIRLSGGGEPMLHPQAVNLIEYAKSVGAKIGLITNGSRFTKRTLEKIIQVGIDVIEFSADAGDNKTYAAVRPGLDWSKLVTYVKLARYLREITKSKTRIIVSIINQMSVDTEVAKKFWEPLVDAVQIRKFLTWGYNKDFSGDKTPYLDPKDRIPCPWLFERLNVDSTGAVTFCGEDIAFNYKFANINNKSIEEIWSGSEFKRIREAHLNRCGDTIEICKNCPDWKFRSWEHNYWKLIKNKLGNSHANNG